MYARFENADTMIFPLTVWSPQAYIEQDRERAIVPRGYFWESYSLWPGYNFFLFLALRDPYVGYYVFFILSYGLFQASTAGFTTQYLWPNLLWWNHRAVPFFGSMGVITLLKFTSAFLMTKIHLPQTSSPHHRPTIRRYPAPKPAVRCRCCKDLYTSGGHHIDCYASEFVGWHTLLATGISSRTLFRVGVVGVYHRHFYPDVVQPDDTARECNYEFHRHIWRSCARAVALVSIGR